MIHASPTGVFTFAPRVEEEVELYSVLPPHDVSFRALDEHDQVVLANGSVCWTAHSHN